MSDLSFQKEYKEGIEFYVSDDGETTGMSIRGLARCCGVRYNSIYSLLIPEKATNSVGYNLLKSFAGKLFILTNGENDEIENNAKLVHSEVCAEIITYYAYESKTAKNDVAKETLKKFMHIGIHKWIKQIVGHPSEQELAESHKQDLILSRLDIITDDLVRQKERNEKLYILAGNYIRVKDGVRAQFPGLDNILDAIEDAKTPRLLPGTKVTLSDWVRSKKINLNNGGYCALGRMVSECYKTMKREEPKKGNRKKSNGKWSMNVRLYGEQDFPILESALEQYMSMAA